MGNVIFYYKIENRWNGNNSPRGILFFFLKDFFRVGYHQEKCVASEMNISARENVERTLTLAILLVHPKILDVND
jgi:hypothetical protein